MAPVRRLTKQAAARSRTLSAEMLEVRRLRAIDDYGVDANLVKPHRTQHAAGCAIGVHPVLFACTFSSVLSRYKSFATSSVFTTACTSTLICAFTVLNPNNLAAA